MAAADPASAKAAAAGRRSPRRGSARPRPRPSAGSPRASRRGARRPCQRARRAGSARRAPPVSGVGGRSSPSRMPSSGIQGTSPASTSRPPRGGDLDLVAGSALAPVPARCAAEPTERSTASRPRTPRTGTQEGDVRRRLDSSARRRDLPMPALPLNSTIEPLRLCASSRTRKAPHLRVRPTRGVSAVASPRSRRPGRRSRPAQVRLSLRLEGLDRGRCEERAGALRTMSVARTAGFGRAITRAAVLIASPKTP